MGAKNESGKVEYHYGFYGAVHAVYEPTKVNMEYLQEHELGKEPVRMDMLIIKRESNPLADPIGSFFRRFNVLEYKSPNDGLTENDFYKVQGYALLYKGLSRHTDDVPVRELTVSIFRHAYPREMMAALQNNGHFIDEPYPGVYRVRGELSVPAQVVVTSRLPEGEYGPFKALAPNATLADIRKLLNLGDAGQDPRMADYVRAVLNVSIVINRELFDRIREDGPMNAAVARYFEAELETRWNEGLAAGEKRGMEIGEKRGMEIGEKKGMEIGEKRGMEIGQKQGISIGRSDGRIMMLSELVKESELTLERAAALANMTPAEFEAEVKRIHADME